MMKQHKYPDDKESIVARRKQIETEDNYPWEKKIPGGHALDILLINPPAVGVYGKYKEAAKVGAAPQMPLGILYIASVLNKAGHKIKVIDCDVDEVAIDRVVQIVLDDKPDVVGVTATTPIFPSGRTIINAIKGKNSQITTFIGGYHITALPIQSMKMCNADYGFYGEAEVTAVELANYIGECKAKNKDISLKKLKTIKGLLFRDKGRLVANEKRAMIKNLDKLPYPKREYLRYKKYLWSVPGKGLLPVTSLTTQRGCPFQCIFCGVQTIFPGVRFRSIENVMRELDYVVNKLGIKHIQFQDDTLTLNREKVKKMCYEIKKRGLKFTWEGYTRANTIDYEMLKLLKSVGLVRLSFGVESGNAKILKAVKKGVKKEDYEKAYKLCHKLGIETRCSLMIGHPFETKETIRETMKFANSLKCYQAYINITTPYPGSELLELARKRYGGIKLLTENWEEYRRYGNSVMEMNDLTVKDLIKLQKWTYRKFYLRPHIILYNIKRAGLKAAIRNGIAFFKSVFN